MVLNTDEDDPLLPALRPLVVFCAGNRWRNPLDGPVPAHPGPTDISSDAFLNLGTGLATLGDFPNL